MGLWAHEGAIALQTELLAGNQGTAFHPEMKGSFYPDSSQCTHTPSPLPGRCSQCDKYRLRDFYFFPQFLTSSRGRIHSGGTCKETDSRLREVSVLSLQVSIIQTSPLQPDERRTCEHTMYKQRAQNVFPHPWNIMPCPTPSLYLEISCLHSHVYSCVCEIDRN